MKIPMLHIRNLEGEFIQAECTECPFPEVRFEANKVGTGEEIMSSLRRQFTDHCQTVHEVEGIVSRPSPGNKAWLPIVLAPFVHKALDFMIDLPLFPGN